MPNLLAPTASRSARGNLIQLIESDLFLSPILPGSHFSISSKSPLVRGGLVTFPMFPTVQTSSNHCWNFCLTPLLAAGWGARAHRCAAWSAASEVQVSRPPGRCSDQSHESHESHEKWMVNFVWTQFSGKNVELTHWTMKHIGKFTLNKTRNWLRTGGLSNQPIYWGVVGCFMGYINTMKWGSPRKNWGSTSTSHQKLVTPIHPTQMCFPSLAFSFRSPWFPHRVSARQSRGSGLPAQNNGRIPGPHRPVFALRKMCVYIYTHIYLFVCLFIYLFVYLFIYWHIVVYWYVLFMCISFIESMVKSRILFTTHEITVCLENWSISRSKLRNHCNYTQGHPANHHLRGTEGSSQLGVMVKKYEKIKRSKNIQKYEITKSPNYWRYHLAQSFNGDFWNHHDRTLRQLVTSGISISSWGYHQQTMRYNQHGTTDYCGHNFQPEWLVVLNQNLAQPSIFADYPFGPLTHTTVNRQSAMASAVLLCLLLLILGDHTFLWEKKWWKMM